MWQQCMHIHTHNLHNITPWWTIRWKLSFIKFWLTYNLWWTCDWSWMQSGSMVDNHAYWLHHAILSWTPRWRSPLIKFQPTHIFIGNVITAEGNVAAQHAYRLHHGIPSALWRNSPLTKFEKHNFHENAIKVQCYVAIWYELLISR